MRAVVCTGAGGREVLGLDEVPDPVPGPGEILLRVRATAVNRADIMQRQGNYPPPPGASDVLGLECAGHVLAVGAGVDGWAVGDPACALLAGGGYAEQVVVPAGQVVPVPAGIELAPAGGLVEVAATVWSNVFMLAGLQRGETLLVHGGAGGIGTMAIQLAVALGARVAVTAGSPARLERCAALGAEVLVDYHEQDFVAEVLAATDGRGADVVLDSLGASYLTRNLETLATSGRLVIIGLQGGAKAEIDLSTLLVKRCAVLATTLRARPPAEKAAIMAGVVEHVWPLVADGVVQPVVHTTLPLEQVAEAHRIVEDGEAVGKVVLTVG
ncbi:MAG: Alcohol dehydrogenase, zinc-binding domain protein [Nocardioidaceae bacterium]|jgi:putative PIG3 family NAD(P)H quinone oxidoreductase|nr:Alcohol dehydrogenase, zinc-binding domain protein [Nocardioidaceae bacterium]